jgi:UDP-N-acetyl-D-glucosamine dehydrogenase
LTAKYDLAIIGLGYVGLPLAIEATVAGMRVAGLDQDAERIQALGAGTSYVDDISGEQIRGALESGRFTPTEDPGCLGLASTIVICVPTPLRNSIPDLSAVLAAGEAAGRRLRPGALVILESTTYPGTTEEMLLPLLERPDRRVGQDFHLAFSPERIDPGNARFGLRNTPKVVGGVTESCARAAERFYARLVEKVVPVSSPRVAEMTKLLENTYRQVNIALMNEMAVFCHELGVDLWESIAAASTKPFGFQPFHPGPGVGGHCIPIDPNYLSYRVRALGYPFRFVELAQEINARMPAFVVSRVTRLLNDRCRSVRGAKILLLGVTYKADIADERESPAREIAHKLLALGAELAYHDPYVAEWRVGERHLKSSTTLHHDLTTADLVVLVQAHGCYDLAALAESAPLLFDTRGCSTGENVVRL